MKKVRLYIPNVLLTILLVFLIMGSEATILANRIGLHENTFYYLIEQQKLDEKGYESLTSYFTTRSNSTGIPENVFLDAFSKNDLRTAISSNAAQALAYLKGNRDTYEQEIDFTGLETSVNAFFSDYAEENGVEKDEVYEEKVRSVLDEAEAQICIAADPFKFSTLQENGWLSKVRQAVSYLTTAMMICLGAGVLTLVLLILCNLRQVEHLCYWIGLAGFTAGLLTCAPCIYLTASDFFSGFAIKDPQVFAAIVGFLKLLTSRCLTIAIITLIVGAIGMAGFAFLRAVQREDEEEV